MSAGSTAVAIVGCGFVADYYLATMANHPALTVSGVYDRDMRRAEAFATYHGLRRYTDFESMLADDTVDLVVNLTSPESHYEVSRQALVAGKHVYSEKPIATSLTEGAELVELAERSGLVLGVAPCVPLGETAQTLWRAVRQGEIGRPQIVYAELDDGAIHQMPYKTWRSPSGAPWPYLNEFRHGCTLEHAGYHLALLIAMFGAVAELTAFASTVVATPEVDRPAPDLTISCLRFRTGVVARLTCSIVAPQNHSLVVVGEEGALMTVDAWDFGSPVYVRRALPPERRQLTGPMPYPLVRECTFEHRYEGAHAMDFARGVAEVASSAIERRPCRLPARHALHALELIVAISNGESRRFDTRLEPIMPMPWAMDQLGT
jgi:predicted dehydrogenase